MSRDISDHFLLAGAVVASMGSKEVDVVVMSRGSKVDDESGAKRTSAEAILVVDNRAAGGRYTEAVAKSPSI